MKFSTVLCLLHGAPIRRSASSDWESHGASGKFYCEAYWTNWWVWRTAASIHGEMEAAARLLGRRPRFTGTETEWSRWSLHARAHVDTVSPSVADHVDSVEANVDRANPLSSLSDVAAENVRKMFHALTMLLQGPLLLLLKTVLRGSGFETCVQKHALQTRGFLKWPRMSGNTSCNAGRSWPATST